MKGILIIMILAFYGCKGQKNKQDSIIENKNHMQATEKLDFKFLEKAQKVNIGVYNDEFSGQVTGYEYIQEFSDKTIHISGNEVTGYSEIVKYKKSHFESIRQFYPNGHIKRKGEAFSNNFQKGIWLEYDEKGNISNTTDFDRPFKYEWEDILKFASENEIDLNKSTNTVRRINNQQKGEIYWELNYEGKYKSEENKFIIKIDGKTGKILKVQKFVGYDTQKNGVGEIVKYEIIFDAKREELQKQKKFKTYEGKSYTEEEWKVFEQKLWEEFQKKNKK